jgi:hypothetical protein
MWVQVIGVHINWWNEEVIKYKKKAKNEEGR